MTTYKEDIIQALKNLGGSAHLKDIHKEVARLRKGNLNASWTYSIQENLQRHSSDSIYGRGRYGSGENIFYMVKGKGQGIWGLRNYNPKTIRNMFIKLAKEYKSARKEKFKNHPLANYLRKEVPNIFYQSAGNLLKNYKVGSVQGIGSWSKIAWIAIFDLKVTNNATKGYYPVYSLFENGKKVLFSLGQGYYQIKVSYKREAKYILESRGVILRNKIKNFKQYGFKNTSSAKLTISKDIQRDTWVKSSAFGKIYDIKNFPSEEQILKDLKNMLTLYQLAIQRGGTSETTHAIDLEDEEIEKSLKGTEKKAVRFHREKEKTYIKTDPALIKRLKKKFNYTCQACNLKFENIYGDYSDKKDYIEAHHLIPKSEILRKIELGEELKRDENDFAILCANCHRMIHKYACPPLNEFKEKIIKKYKDFLKN